MRNKLLKKFSYVSYFNSLDFFRIGINLPTLDYNQTYILVFLIEILDIPIIIRHLEIYLIIHKVDKVVI